MAAPRKYPDELRERATRIAVELRQDPSTRNGAIHHEWAATRLAEAGVPFLVEKPVAASAEVGARMADVARSAGVVECVGHIVRFNPALQELRRRLEERQLGEDLPSGNETPGAVSVSSCRCGSGA